MDALPYGTVVTHRSHPDWTGTVIGCLGDKARVRWAHLRRQSAVGPERLLVVRSDPVMDLAPLRAILKAALSSALDWERRGHPWPSAPFIVRCLNEIGWT